MKATAIGPAGGSVPGRRPDSFSQGGGERKLVGHSLPERPPSSDPPVRTYRSFPQDNRPIPGIEGRQWWKAMRAAIDLANTRLDEKVGTGRFFLKSD
jgi:hypothetical protein